MRADVHFSSPSQAAAFATDHSCNGWAQWKTRWAINRRLPPASKLFFAALAVIVRHGMAISSGLARVIDDGEMLAYMHWVLVNPKYQGMHVGSGLVERVKERYAGYMFLEVMPEESKTLRSTSATASRSWKTAARCRS